VLEGDIKGCFDNISHQWLLGNVPLNKAILRKWLTFGKPGTRGILQAYNYEKYANHLDRLSGNERLEQIIRDMDEVHPNLRRNLETVVIKSWETDPWQRGAYPVYPVGQLKWYADICKPEGGVWFAGDHASGLPGWIEGAITSGLKAAQDVNAKLESSETPPSRTWACARALHRAGSKR